MFGVFSNTATCGQMRMTYFVQTALCKNYRGFISVLAKGLFVRIFLFLFFPEYLSLIFSLS